MSEARPLLLLISVFTQGVGVGITLGWYIAQAMATP